jgi:hypothetical protein
MSALTIWTCFAVLKRFMMSVLCLSGNALSTTKCACIVNQMVCVCNHYLAHFKQFTLFQGEGEDF